MSNENERVTVRRLPDGTPQSGVLESFTGNSLQIILPADTPVEFCMGNLVEVGSEEALYLGEVQGRRDALLIIAVEHSMRRSSLSAIQAMWNCSRGA